MVCKCYFRLSSFLLSLATVGILGQGMTNMIFSHCHHRVGLLCSGDTISGCQGGSLCLPGLSSFISLKTHILPFILQAYFDYCADEYRNIILMISGFFLLGNRCEKLGHDAACARAIFKQLNLDDITARPLAIILTVLPLHLLPEML